MTFLHPWAIALGVLTAGLPVAVHFLTRPRPVRMPLSTLRFLREAVHQRRARHILRDFIILALRTLAILLIALAIARPQWGQRPLISEGHDDDAVRVVALDVSQSMAATDHGIAALERARTAVANYLRYRPNLEVNLLLAGAAPRSVFESPSTNFDALRDELAAARELPQRVDVQKIVETAGKMLAPQSPEDKRRRELVIVSDFQRSAWAKANFASLPEGTQIQFESVAPAETPPNVAILAVRAVSQESGGGQAQLEVDVHNYSTATRKVEVEVQIGDSLWHLKAACSPERMTTLAQEIEWKRTGWQAGEARLLGCDDALKEDNVRPFVVHIQAQPVYALVTRQSAAQRPSSSHYLECALAPKHGDREKAAQVRRIDPAEADTAALAPADLILLDHPGKLADDKIKLLASFLRRGRPMLYVAAEMIDATNLKNLAEAAGSGVQLPVEFTPPAAGQSRRDLTLAAVKRDRPPFNVFGDNLNAIVGQLRFAGGLNSRRVEGRIAEDVLASYSDGSASVVLASSDAGSLAVINADLKDSNIPKTWAFLPLVEELVHGLLDRGRVNDTAYCGEQMVVQLPGDVGPSPGLKLVGLSAESIARVEEAQTSEKPCGELGDESAGAVWRWNAPVKPGVYGVKHDQNVIFAKAVALPPDESDLETLDLAKLTDRLAAGHAAYYHSATAEGQRRDDLWMWLVSSCVLCMIGETGAMIIFRD
jgi:hypothetical protein